MPSKRTADVKKSQMKFNAQWTKNALKSIGILTRDTLSELAPNLTETTVSALDTSKNIFTNLTRNKNGLNKVNTALESNKYVRAAQATYKNSLKQLKSGNLFEDVDDSNDSSISFGDSDTGDTYNITEGPSNATLANVGNAINEQSQIQVKLAQANLETMVSINSASMQQTQQIGSEILDRLDKVNNQLSALVQYQNDNVTKYIEASIAYFEKTGSRLAPEGNRGESNSIKAGDVLRSGGGGGIDIAKYKELVKKQFGESIDASSFGAIKAILSNDAMLEAFVRNPLGMIGPMLATSVIPAGIKNTISAAETAFKNAIPNVLMEINRWGDEAGYGITGEIRRILGKTFGLKVDKRAQNLGAAEINRGAIPFDGETKHAITEIITKELREQTSYLKVLTEHIVGAGAHKKAKGLQTVFDYKTNQYIGLEENDRRIAEALVNSIATGFNQSTFGKEFQKTIAQAGSNEFNKVKQRKHNNSDADAEKAQQEITKAMNDSLNQFYLEINLSGNARLDRKSLEDMVKNMDFTGPYANTVKKMMLNHVKHMNDTDFRGLGAGRLAAGRNRTNTTKDITENPASYNLFSSRFNNQNMTREETDALIEEVLGYRYGVKRKDANKANKERLDNKAKGQTLAENIGDQLGETANIVRRANGKLDEMINGSANGQVKGAIDTAKATLNAGITGWVEALFGRGKNANGEEESDEELKKRVFEEVKEKTKESIPDMKKGAIAGFGVSTGIGALTGAFINPFVGAAIGATSSLVMKNERFQNWLFGEEFTDENGNKSRKGGIIDSNIQKFFKEHKIDLGIGTLGGGLLGAMVGGPITGALMGFATSAAKNTSIFKRFLYGDEDKGIPGFFTGIAEWYNKGNRGRSTFNQDAKVAGMGAIGAVTGAALVKMGVIGSALMPFGPIGGAILGLSAGITAAGGGLRQALFGSDEVDEWTDDKGEKHSIKKSRGLIGYIGDNIKLNIINPVKTMLTGKITNLFISIEEHLLNPIKFMGMFVAKNLGKVLGNIATGATQVFKNIAMFPVNVLKTALTPVTRMVGGLASFIGGGVIGGTTRGLDFIGGGVNKLLSILDPELGRMMETSRKEFKDTRKAVRKQNKINKKHDRNARLIYKLSGGRYSEDTEEARQYIKSTKYEDYEKYFGAKSGNIMAKDTARNANLANLTPAELLKTNPEMYYQRLIYDYIVARGRRDDAASGQDTVSPNGEAQHGQSGLAKARKNVSDTYNAEINAIDDEYQQAKANSGFLGRRWAGLKRTWKRGRAVEKLKKSSKALDKWEYSTNYDPTATVEMDAEGNITDEWKKTHRASGGDINETEMATVGEHGQETAILPKGSTIYKHGEPVPVQLTSVSRNIGNFFKFISGNKTDAKKVKQRSFTDAIRENGTDLNEKRKAKQEAQLAEDLHAIREGVGEATKGALKNGGVDNKGQSTGSGLLGLLGGLASGFHDMFGIKGIVTAGLVLAAPYIIRHLPDIVKGLPTLIANVGSFVTKSLPNIIKTVEGIGKTIADVGEIVVGIGKKLGIDKFIEGLGETAAGALDESVKEREKTEKQRARANGMTSQQSADEFADRNIIEHLSLIDPNNGAVKTNANAMVNFAAHIPQIAKLAVLKAAKNKGAIGELAKTALARQTVKDAIKVGNTNAMNLGLQQLERVAGKGGSSIANATLSLADNAAGAAKTTAQGIGGKIMGSKAGQAISAKATEFGAKLAESKGGQLLSKVKGMISAAFKKVGLPEGLLGNLFKFMAEKWNNLVVKISELLGGRVSTTAISFGLSEAVFATIGGINGATGAAKLFHVDKQYVDNTMIMISTAFGAFTGTTVGAILDLIASIYNSITGDDILHNIAVGWYKSIKKNDDDAIAKLDEGISDFDNKYADYQAKAIEEAYNEQIADGTLNPNVTLDEFRQGIQEGKYEAKYMSKSEFNADQHKDLGGHIVSTVAKVGKGALDLLKNVPGAIKKAGKGLRNAGIGGDAMAGMAVGGLAGFTAVKGINALYDRFGKKVESTVYRPLANPLTYYRADKDGKTFSLYNDNGDLIAEKSITAEEMDEMQKNNSVKEDKVELDSRNTAFLDQVKGIGASIKEGATTVVNNLKEKVDKALVKLKNKDFNGQTATGLALGGFGGALAVKAINALYDKFGKKTAATIYRPISDPLTYYKADKDGKTFTLYSDNGDIITEHAITAEEMEELQKSNMVNTDMKLMDSRSTSFVDRIKGIGSTIKDATLDMITRMREGAEKLADGIRKKAGGVLGSIKDKATRFLKSPAGSFLSDVVKKGSIAGAAFDVLYSKMTGGTTKVKIYRPIDQPLCYYMADKGGKTYTLYNSNGDVVNEKAITNDELQELIANSLVTEDTKEVADSEVKTSDKIKNVLKGVREKLGDVWKSVADGAKKGIDALKKSLGNLGGMLFGVKEGGGGFGQGEVLNGGTYYSQNDSRWGSTPYTVGRDNATMKTSGCGPTAMAMAMSDATGRNISPMEMAQLAKATGNRDSTGTNANFISTAAMANGVPSKQAIHPSGKYLQREIARGKKVVMLGNGGSAYTKNGHYIVGERVTRDGKILVNDPRGKGYSKEYDANQLSKNTRASWSLGGHGQFDDLLGLNQPSGPNLMQMAGVQDTYATNTTPIINAAATSAPNLNVTDVYDFKNIYSDSKAMDIVKVGRTLGYSDDILGVCMNIAKDPYKFSNKEVTDAHEILTKINSNIHSPLKTEADYEANIDADGAAINRTTSTTTSKSTDAVIEKDEAYYESMLDADGAVKEDHASRGDRGMGHDFSEKWLTCVAEVKAALAASGATYYSEYGKNVTITVNGQTYTFRPDCSGFVSGCLQVIGHFPKGTQQSSGNFTSNTNIHLDNNGWSRLPFTGWDDLKPGDIIASNNGSKDHHVEIFSRNADGKHYVYNAGSTKSVQTPGETVDSGNSHNYTAVWRPSSDAKSSFKAGGEVKSGEENGNDKTSVNANAVVDKEGSGKKSPWEKLGIALTTIAGTAFNALFSDGTKSAAEYKNDFIKAYKEAIDEEDESEGAENTVNDKSVPTNEAGSNAAGSETSYTTGSSAGLADSSIKPISNIEDAYKMLESLNLSEKKTKFFKAILPGALQSKAEDRVRPSITLAQAALESNWGESGLATKYKNLFGIKAGKSWTGPTANMLTKEEVGGSLQTQNASWRVYPTWNDSVLDHGKLFRKERYQPTVNAGTYKLATEELGRSGYATDSGYGNKILNMIETNKLYSWDNFDPKYGPNIESDVDQQEHEAQMLDADGAVIQNNSKPSTTKLKTEADYEANVDADGAYIGGGYGMGSSLKSSGIVHKNTPNINILGNNRPSTTNVGLTNLNLNTMTKEQADQIILYLSKLVEISVSSNGKLDGLGNIGGNKTLVVPTSGKTSVQDLQPKHTFTDNNRNSQVAQRIASGSSLI